MKHDHSFDAIFLDPAQQFRVLLRTRWNARPDAVWLMMNPSLANAHRSDRTVDRAIHFSKQVDCGGLVVVNLWPLVTPRSAELWKAVPTMDPRLIEANKEAIGSISSSAAIRVVAFGAHAGRAHRRHVETMLDALGGPLLCLGISSRGWPLHPMARGRMRIPDDRPLAPWTLP